MNSSAIIRRALFAMFASMLAWTAAADVSGDYRSVGSGNWDAAATWETFDGSAWISAATKPAAANPVFIQSGHVVTLTGNEACKDLHISTGTTGASTGSDAQVALGTFTLEINGKLRDYFGVVGGSGNLPGTSSGLSAHAAPITMTAGGAGRIKFVGGSRTIIAFGDWSSSNTGSSTTYATEIALNSGQVASVTVSFKTSELLVSSGTLSMASGTRVGLDNGAATANATISSGAVLASAASGTGAGVQIMSRTTSGRAGTLTVQSGGKLLVTGGTPRIDMSAHVINGTIEYAAAGGQTLLAKSQDAASADVTAYANLILSGSGAKTLSVNTTVNGTLTVAGTASLALGSSTLAYGPAATLEYAGTSAQSAGAEFPASGSPNNVTINNASGVVLTGSRTVNGTLTLTSGQFNVGANSLTLNGPAIAGMPGNLVTTPFSTLAFGGSAMGVNVPSSVTALNNLVVGNPNGVTLNAAPNIASGLKLDGGKLGLNFSGAANVGALSFDNGATWQSAGTYGFTGSGAANEDAAHFLTSAPLGILSVLSDSPPLLFRTVSSGNWDSASTWESSADNVNWAAAAAKPGPANSVFVQAGHVVPLTGNEACRDLHISTGTTGETVGGDGQVALGANVLEINGKLRCYVGTVGGSLPGTSSALGNISAPITIIAASSGRVRFVGNSRVIFATGEWSSGNTGSATTYATEIALNGGQTATAQTVFKTSALTVTSGTLDSSFRIGLDKGAAGQGDLTIASGAVFRSSGSGVTSGNQVLSRGPTTVGGTLTIEDGGKLQLSGGTPSLDMSAYVFKGAVEYTGAAQTLARKSGLDPAAVELSDYGTLILAGSGAKTLVANITVSSNLTLAGTASLALGGQTLAYGASSTLQYAGSAAQTTADTEFPATGGPNDLQISNAAGVTLNGGKAINGVVAVNSGASLNFGGHALTAGSAALNGSMVMQVNKSAGPTLAAAKLNLTSASPLSFGGALTVTATGDALSGGEAFDLFDAAGGFAGGFTATNLPALPVQIPALNWYAGQLSAAGSIVVNRAPLAHAISAGVAQGDSASLLIIGGKQGPTDADGDTLAVSSVQSPSANGAGVSTDGNQIVVNYGSVAGFSGSDSFTFTVSDGKGGMNVATVSMLVSPAGAGANLIPGSLGVSGGVATVQAQGIPGAYYHLQYTTSLNPVNWQDASGSHVQANPATGRLVLTDSGASEGSRYYRTRYVSGP